VAAQASEIIGKWEGAKAALTLRYTHLRAEETKEALESFGKG
jgi:hypothetical protein